MFRYHQLINNLPDFFKNYFVTNNQIHEAHEHIKS